MILRAAVSADAADFAEIHALAFETPWSAGDIRPFIDNHAAFGFAAHTEDGALAGFILCRVMAGEAEVLTIAVHPDHRRRGYAAALVARAMSQALLTADAMFLEVAADNPGAAALYERAGFVAVGRRPGYYSRREGGSIDAVVMRRTLNS
jgi:ribosomal-protein-alanine N-acetyltransferase